MFLGITIEEGNGGKDVLDFSVVSFSIAPVFLRWKTLLEESRSPDVGHAWHCDTMFGRLVLTSFEVGPPPFLRLPTRLRHTCRR